MKAKINRIKFFNSVKASFKGGINTELSFVDINEKPEYQISIDGVFITLYNTRTEEAAYSTIHNVVYFTTLD
jgi:hypothetical protein